MATKENFSPKGCHELPKISHAQAQTPKTTWTSKRFQSRNNLSSILRTAKDTNKDFRLQSEHESVLKRYPGLVQSILRLKHTDTIGGKSLLIAQHTETLKAPIFNDFHSRQTNAGYSRNKLGGFFTK